MVRDGRWGARDPVFIFVAYFLQLSSLYMVVFFDRVHSLYNGGRFLGGGDGGRLCVETAGWGCSSVSTFVRLFVFLFRLPNSSLAL